MKLQRVPLSLTQVILSSEMQYETLNKLIWSLVEQLYPSVKLQSDK